MDPFVSTYNTNEMPADPHSSGQTQFRLAEIDINLSPSDEKITGLFRIDSEQRGKKGPVLVILAEIASTLYVYEQLLDTLEQAAEQTRHLLAAVDTDSIVRFEKITQKVNEAIANFVANEPTRYLESRQLIRDGVFRARPLPYRESGGCQVSFYKNKRWPHARGLIFNSLNNREINAEKPFSSLICGDMHPGDILFAGTLRNFERLRQNFRSKNVCRPFLR